MTISLLRLTPGGGVNITLPSGRRILRGLLDGQGHAIIRVRIASGRHPILTIKVAE
ncbi:MAG: hypothetical protein ABFE07_21195 [Armatimonadia bacterium]